FQTFRAPATVSTRENSFFAFIRSLKPAMAFSLAAAALIILVGAALLIKDGLRLRSQLAQLQAERQSEDSRRQQLETEIANERKRSEDLARQLEGSEREDKTRIQQEGKKSEPTSTVPTSVALTLLPGLSRSSNTAPTLRLSPGVTTVRLQVGMDLQDNYPRYG